MRAHMTCEQNMLALGHKWCFSGVCVTVRECMSGPRNKSPEQWRKATHGVARRYRLLRWGNGVLDCQDGLEFYFILFCWLADNDAWLWHRRKGASASAIWDLIHIHCEGLCEWSSMKATEFMDWKNIMTVRPGFFFYVVLGGVIYCALHGDSILRVMSLIVFIKHLL